MQSKPDSLLFNHVLFGWCAEKTHYHLPFLNIKGIKAVVIVLGGTLGIFLSNALILRKRKWRVRAAMARQCPGLGGWHDSPTPTTLFRNVSLIRFHLTNEIMEFTSTSTPHMLCWLLPSTLPSPASYYSWSLAHHTHLEP